MQRLTEVGECFIMECDLEHSFYRGIIVQGTRGDLQNLANWVVLLQGRSLKMIDKRFSIEQGGLLWAASLFDRRTWPLADMRFNLKDVECKLQCLKAHFPASTRLDLSAAQFISLAQRIAQEVPPMRSTSGRIQGLDAMEAWVYAANNLQAKDWQAVLDCAIQLCTVPLSQTHCEQLVHDGVLFYFLFLLCIISYIVLQRAADLVHL